MQDESYMIIHAWTQYINALHMIYSCLKFFPFPTHMPTNMIVMQRDFLWFLTDIENNVVFWLLVLDIELHSTTLWGFQREQACDLHGQRLQCWVADRGQQARLAQSQYNAQGHCNLEFGEEQDPRPNYHVRRCDFVHDLMLWTTFPFCKASPSQFRSGPSLKASGSELHFRSIIS